MSEIDPDLEIVVIGPPPGEGTRSAAPEGEGFGDPLHVYGPRVRIHRAPVGAAESPLSRAAEAPPSDLSENERLGLEAFQLRRSSAYRSAKLDRPRDGEPWNMQGCRPPPELGREVIVSDQDDLEEGARAIGPTAIATLDGPVAVGIVGSSRVDLQACKLEYSIVSPK